MRPSEQTEADVYEVPTPVAVVEPPASAPREADRATTYAVLAVVGLSVAAVALAHRLSDS